MPHRAHDNVTARSRMAVLTRPPPAYVMASHAPVDGARVLAILSLIICGGRHETLDACRLDPQRDDGAWSDRVWIVDRRDAAGPTALAQATIYLSVVLAFARGGSEKSFRASGRMCMYGRVRVQGRAGGERARTERRAAVSS